MEYVFLLLLAIAIVCLIIFGMSKFSASSKQPEEKVQKVEPVTAVNISSFARKLLSKNVEERDTAINHARSLCNEGNREGLHALEEAIGHMHGRKNIQFHTPGIMTLDGFDSINNSYGELKKLAGQRLLWEKSPHEVQKLFSASVLSVPVHTMLDEIKGVGGDNQAMAIQLLGTHLIAQAALRNKS